MGTHFVINPFAKITLRNGYGFYAASADPDQTYSVDTTLVCEANATYTSCTTPHTGLESIYHQ